MAFIFKATFSMQKGWLCKRRTTVILINIPVEIALATPMIIVPLLYLLAYL
jgi:hypothetical protein